MIMVNNKKKQIGIGKHKNKELNETLEERLDRIEAKLDKLQKSFNKFLNKK